MTARLSVPNRRASETFDLNCARLTYTATVSWCPDGHVAEIFLANRKAGSQSDTNARDAAVVCSIALQHGVTVDVIRHASLRDGRGIANSPPGVALDIIATEMRGTT
jgi:hypothetical protein